MVKADQRFGCVKVESMHSQEHTVMEEGDEERKENGGLSEDGRGYLCLQWPLCSESWAAKQWQVASVHPFCAIALPRRVKTQVPRLGNSNAWY